MKDVIGKAMRTWGWSLLIGLLFGTWTGGAIERSKFFNDCRYAGFARIGESAFKCEQFSKVVLLTPEEVVKKEAKK